jgi:hypothetical protein
MFYSTSTTRGNSACASAECRVGWEESGKGRGLDLELTLTFAQYSYMRITYTMRAQTIFFVINISFIIFTFRLYFFYFMAIVVDLFYLLILFR